MILIDKKGREVEIVDIDYGSHPEDTYFVAGYYTDTEEELSVGDLAELESNHGEEIYEAWQDHMQGQADFLHDYMKENGS